MAEVQKVFLKSNNSISPTSTDSKDLAESTERRPSPPAWPSSPDLPQDFSRPPTKLPGALELDEGDVSQLASRELFSTSNPFYPGANPDSRHEYPLAPQPYPVGVLPQSYSPYASSFGPYGPYYPRSSGTDSGYASNNTSAAPSKNNSPLPNVVYVPSAPYDGNTGVWRSPVTQDGTQPISDPGPYPYASMATINPHPYSYAFMNSYPPDVPLAYDSVPRHGGLAEHPEVHSGLGHPNSVPPKDGFATHKVMNNPNSGLDSGYVSQLTSPDPTFDDDEDDGK